MESVFGTLFSRRVPPTDSSKRTRGKRPQPQPPQSLLTRLTRLWEDNFLLLTPSPQEHSAVRITTLDDDPTWRSRQNEYKHRAPPLGYVLLKFTILNTMRTFFSFIRLAFYSDLTKLYLDIEPDIESFIRLSPSGDLDLRKLRHQWGLETCAVRTIYFGYHLLLTSSQPIHPLKWKIEETADRDWMSPLAVHNNMDHQVNCIKFTGTYDVAHTY